MPALNYACSNSESTRVASRCSGCGAFYVINGLVDYNIESKNYHSSTVSSYSGTRARQPKDSSKWIRMASAAAGSPWVI